MKSTLAEVAGLLAQLPLPLLVIGHSLTVSAWFKRAHGERYLLNYWTAFLGAFGGGIVSALLLQDTSKAAIALLTKNPLGVWWTLCWWGINYCPGDLVARLHALLPIRAAARACLAILRSGMIAHRVGAAATLFPGVVAAPLVIGTIGGCGGKVISDIINASVGLSKGPAELSQPGFSMRSSFLASLSCYLLVHVWQVLTEQEGLALLTSALVLHAVGAEMTGRRLDFTEPLGRLFHKVTLIPEPGQPSSSKPRNGKVKAAPSNPVTPTPSATKHYANPNGDGAAAAEKQNVPANVAATPGRVTRRRRAAAAAGSD